MKRFTVTIYPIGLAIGLGLAFTPFHWWALLVAAMSIQVGIKKPD